MRPARRLIVALACLAAIDPLVPVAQRRLESRRYDAAPAFRFESSDLFGLGPFVSYLRDHPRGPRPRALFLGNSLMFGYELAAADAVPAQFRQRHPEMQVFNAAVNGFDLGSNYLVAKAAIDAVDRIYVMRGKAAVHPLLASLIPVEADDVRAFHLQEPDPVEARLQSMTLAWRLYASTYRLQAALFGTSTRQYLHLLTRPAVIRTVAPREGTIALARSRSATAPGGERRAELRGEDPLLWTFAEMAYAHRTRVVFLQIGSPTPGAIGAAEMADFNAAFDPYAEIVQLTIPAALTTDGRHLTPAGARQVAGALP